jgi:hypothetical protein
LPGDVGNAAVFKIFFGSHGCKDRLTLPLKGAAINQIDDLFGFCRA